eukprot:CAMPEP_0172442726 /NCGR_PEP_ID=MMETSP1065-20121228/3117_1 /TAXON_ID=265537 /ORGANISM="Amphiprora paludosa, Strain CCMP125" /LENGTH=1450 /DNA_ID=CAMNT_0013192713 /DNA_START=206 /DNA_END=4558 /DNA_ORIENTATION=-
MIWLRNASWGSIVAAFLGSLSKESIGLTLVGATSVTPVGANATTLNPSETAFISNLLNTQNESTIHRQEKEDVDEEEEEWKIFHKRFLKEKEKEDSGRLDYSVLSVGVMTLGLILVVEVVRHKLDHSAEGRPYFTAVLENIYAELTTLGIVEFCVFLLQEYHTTMDKEKKDVFGAVHFALFYTALFNAFQSVVLCFITTRISHKMWVQTEALELHHYVEVREAFERVEATLRKNHPAQESPSTTSEDDPSNVNPEDGKKSPQHDDIHTEYVFEISWKGVRALFARVMDVVRYPQLMQRYNQLLMQVRFHELRVHFLQSNNLPAKLQVSDYLVRCEQRLLIKMAHVSAAAWLLLTASINVLYFLMGIMGTQTEDPDIVGTTLTYIFFCSMALFVVLALVVYNKMKKIFAIIMHREDFWDAEHQDDETRRKLSDEQRNLFWLGSPGLVIAALQFMQFGYAIALASVIMFWEDIDDGSLGMVWYWITIFVCYGLFVAVSAEVIPRYTMCTSLGELVDKKRLDSTLASFHLEEAKRHRLEESYIHAYHEAHLPQIIKEEHPTEHEIVFIPKSQSGNSLSSYGSEVDPTPVETGMSRREMRKRQRSVSDGVALMAAMKDDGPARAKDDMSVSPFTRSRTPQQRRQKQGSEGVSSMASTGSAGTGSGTAFEKIAQLVKMDTKTLRQAVSAEDMKQMENKEKTSLKRREKSLSDGVSSMASSKKPSVGMDYTADETSSPAKDESSMVSSGDISDVDDIPFGEYETSLRQHSVEPKEHVSPSQLFKEYFASKNYRVMSHVFGTMVAFFLIGLRVEKFLHTEGILPDYFITFGLEAVASFWLLSGWLVMFLLGDVLIFFSINNQDTGRKIRVLRVASAIDFLITGVCLIVFWCGEMRRCCEPSEEERWLAEEVDGKDSAYSDPSPCSCPTFGSRTYSGLGTLEPYTALVSLRLFRFLAAKKILARIDESWSSQSGDDTDSDGLEIDNFAQTTRADPLKKEPAHQEDHGGHDNGHDHGHGNSRGTAAELWEEAMSQHPDIAEKYGVFSSEMLQVMLGIPLSRHSHEEIHDEDEANTVHKPNYAIEEKYSSLPPETQEVIMAGMLGKDVKFIENNVREPVGTIPEEGISEGRSKSYVFEVADDSSIPPHITLTDEVMFDVPHANLVRSMRRCDRKVLPILDKWSVVDVAMTRFEIVYFDASEFNSTPHSEAIRQALIATKGGKGLRLSDVAVGRKVVGHLRLSEVSSMAIERYLPSNDPADAEDAPEDSVPGSEFWKGEVSQWLGPPVWNAIRQDTLALHTTAGNTLYLRFYSDYEEAEHHPERLTDENDDEAHIHRNNAFQWAQTVGRFCGPDQLHQSLPHFGDDNNDELRDYLIVHHEGEHKKNRALLAAHGGHLKHTDAVSDLALHSRQSTRDIAHTSQHGNGSARSLSPSARHGRASVRNLFRSSSHVQSSSQVHDC